MSNKGFSIKGWIEILRQEILEMDIDAQHLQAKLWSEFGNNPEFDFLDKQIYDNWERDRYLDWKIISLSLNLKPVSTNLLSRIHSAILWIFKSIPIVYHEKGVYQLCKKSDSKSFELKVVFIKQEGQISVNVEKM